MENQNMSTPEDLVFPAVESFENTVFDYMTTVVKVPDLDELFANFTELDPRNKSFRMPELSEEEDIFADITSIGNYTQSSILHANSPKNFLPDASREDIASQAEQENVGIFSQSDECVFPEPGDVNWYKQTTIWGKGHVLRLGIAILFCILCLGVALGAGTFAVNKMSGAGGIPKYSYSVQSPTMTPAPGDALGNLREGAG
ncbi:MAG: hypothetical protein LBJ12_03780 [Oscillospiraceae bacterium]|jgi:hypothetical protein|nr:hypothetical protein [Oscillospiraceae bacterium]